MEDRAVKIKKIVAAIQIVIIVLIVGFGTWQLFLGNFQLASLSFPLLAAYYVLIVARSRRH